MDHATLTERIIGCAMTVYNTLGPGFVESVYQNALAHELRKALLQVETEKRIQVTYDGIVVGDFRPTCSLTFRPDRNQSGTLAERGT